MKPMCDLSKLNWANLERSRPRTSPRSGLCAESPFGNQSAKRAIMSYYDAKTPRGIPGWLPDRRS